MSDFHRCAFLPDDFGYVLEAAMAAADRDGTVARALIRLGLSMKEALDGGWVWRAEDERA